MKYSRLLIVFCMFAFLGLGRSWGQYQNQQGPVSSINANNTANLAGPDTIKMIQEPKIVGDKCQFEISYRFDKQVLQIGDLAPDVPNFARSGDDPTAVGQSTYNFTYTMSLDEENTFDAQILPGVACFGAEDPCLDVNKNIGSDPFSQLISCKAQANNQFCSGQEGTMYNPVTKTCDKDITATKPSETVCTPQCSKNTQACLGGQCVCVPSANNCCGVSLLTNVPFIGKCIQLISEQDKALLIAAKLYNTDPNTLVVTETEAFPRLMLGLTKILVTVILLGSFIAIIVAGVMIAASGGSDSSAAKGRQLIGSVIAALALLGASGVILRLINPNFFG